MKNKKLLTRLFALLASLVLVLALALPCFAEEADSSQQYLLTERSFNSYNEFYQYVMANPQFIAYVFMQDTNGMVFRFSGTISILAVFTCDLRYTENDAYQNVEVSVVLAPTSASYITKLNDNEPDVISLDESALNTLFSGASIYIYESAQFAPTDPSTPSSDMYSNLFNILKDAVYGSDAELTGSQEYALTLISTILTYATILLPVILVIFIAVWCFKRF